MTTERVMKILEEAIEGWSHIDDWGIESIYVSTLRDRMRALLESNSND